MIIIATILAWIGWIVGVAGILGLVVILTRAVRQAPRGYEDRTGFHHVDARPERRLPKHFTRHHITQ